MADTHETIADIRRDAEAKFRELVEAYMQRRAAFQTTVGAMQAFNTVFDRLEAAHRRDTKELRVEIERLKEERNYSGVRERERLRANGFAIVPKEQLERGDAAKLREAIAKCVNLITEFGNAEIVKTSLDVIIDIEAILNAALSAPPRNCDLPEVAKAQPNLAEQAWRVFRRSHKDSNLDAYGLLRCIRWLLAPATEKEGGDK